jgi:3'(2'), 5'-bisphosphate nucleotidase
MISLDVLASIARDAGQAILPIYHSEDFEIQIKSDDSPVTKADLRSNEIIIKKLAEVSKLPVVTEESYVEYDIRKHWRKFWLVDPLDGTKDFIAHNGQFTINIALIDNGTPVMGVVYVPDSGDVYSAQQGLGAFKNGESIFNRSVRSELIASDSIFHSTPAVEMFFERHSIRQVIKFGAAIKICKLAEGIIDVYPRLNGTKEWDTAACHIIANEAGCKVIDVETGAELVYNKTSMKNSHFVASRNDLDFSAT